MLEPRHGGENHNANLIYGYILLALTALHALAMPLASAVYRRSWLIAGHPTTVSRYLTRTPNTAKVVAYTVLTVGLCVYGLSPATYVTSIKRAGRIAYVLLPLDILLALKPSPLGNYLEFVPLHKWLSRLVVLLSTIHGLGFAVIWGVRKESQLLKLFKPLNFLGVVATLLFLTLAVVSLPTVRRRAYGLFYLVHQVTVWLVVFLIAFHARPGVLLYAGLCAFLLCLLVVLKVIHTKDVMLQEENFRSAQGSLLMVVTLPTSKLSLAEIQPGSHMRLNEYSKYNYRTWLKPSHPYTVAAVGTHVSLVVKRTAFTPQPNVKYSVFGPPFRSGIAFHPTILPTLAHTVLVCGGAGISFALPIFLQLQALQTDPANLVARDLKLIWYVRRREDLFVLDHFGVSGNVDVYVTGVAEPVSVAGERLEEGGEEMEMATMGVETTPLVDEAAAKGDTKPYTVSVGRSSVATVLGDFNQTLQDNSTNRVIACGPPGLVRECREVANRFHLQFSSEAYEL